MRLTCPNCHATYEVEARLIPAAGRDVQCSACGHAWFSGPGAAGAVPGGGTPFAAPVPPPAVVRTPRSVPAGAETGAEDGEAAPMGAAGAEPPPPRRPPDPEVMRILREEAARERAARAAMGAPLETQPDLGMAPPPRRRRDPAPASAAGENAEEPPGESLGESVGESVGDSLRAGPRLGPSFGRAFGPDADPDPGPDPLAVDGALGPAPATAPDTRPSESRGRLLPDIEGIDTAPPRGEPPRAAAEGAASGRAPDAARQRRRGVAAAVILAAAALGVYLEAPRLAAALPPLAPAFSAYRDTVDEGRIWLHQRLRPEAGAQDA